MSIKKLSLNDFEAVPVHELLEVKGGAEIMHMPADDGGAFCQGETGQTVVQTVFNQLSKLVFGPGGGSLFSTWTANAPTLPSNSDDMSMNDVNWNMMQWANFIDNAAQVEYEQNGPTALALQLSQAANTCRQLN
ncbi:hypothetical protein GO009_17255 [Muricauda sp. TY007]|nr:hypothetical protein [Muricauda sp. TY007]